MAISLPKWRRGCRLWMIPCTRAIFYLMVAMSFLVTANIRQIASQLCQGLDSDTEAVIAPHGGNVVLSRGSNESNARRLFLGILTKREAETRLRNVIRKTYLSFDSKSTYASYSNITSICSYAHYQALLSEQQLQSSECQIVYAFLIRGIYKPSRTEVDEVSDNNHAIELLDELSHKCLKPDILYLNISKVSDENYVFRFYDYLVNSKRFDMDYVGITNSYTVLYPTKIWPRDLFNGKASKERLYGGNFRGSECNAASGCQDHSPNDNVVMKDYFVLSSDLVSHINKDDRAHKHVPNDETEEVIANILDAFETETGDSLVTLPVENGAYPIERVKHEYLSFVQVWDRYKDSFINYSDPQEETMVRSNPSINGTVGTSRFGPRVLLGVFSMDSEEEKQRRATIRETYMRFFSEHEGNSSTTDRICSLMELVTSPKKEELLVDCQLAYVFVIGGNPNGPTELVDFNETTPMTIPRSNASSEDDVVYLNIQENMKSGKSQSFFKYATTVVDNHVYFDYLAKTDTDTLLIPKVFLDENINQLPRFPNNVRIYGGLPRVKEQYGHLYGPIYNQGALYWISPDLARHVTSPACDREMLKVYSEDKSMGNFVHSHRLPIRHYTLLEKPKSIEHPLKDLESFRRRWLRSLLPPEAVETMRRLASSS